MSGSIHKEALADAKKLREIAEANAKNVVIERITPTIKSMIEKELLGESVSGSEMEEDILVSPEAQDTEKTTETSESVQLTTESVQALAKMSSAKSEHYGVRSLRISGKIEKLHEAKISEAAYGEKLRQIKTEIEKTYSDLQEDMQKNIVPGDSSEIISNSLSESWEVTNRLLAPVKVRQINESNRKLSKKVRQFKLIAEECSLTKKAKKSFGDECVKLTEEVIALCNSVAELREVVQDSKADKVQSNVTGLFKEIYTMAKKFSSLNEEELKIVINGLSTDDPEGSALTAMVEPSDDLDDEGLEDEMEDDLGDDMDMGMGDDSMEDDMDMDEVGIYEGEEDDAAMDEYVRDARQAYRREMTRQKQKKQNAPAEQSEEDPESAMDELLGRQYRAGGGGGRRHKMNAIAKQRQADRARAEADKEKGPEMKQDDEMLEISEAMLRQELGRLKARRSAVNEAMKAMQHSPGGGPGALDNFGGAGRELGGAVEGDCFEDGEDLNDLDPVGTGYPVNESEAGMDEYVRDGAKAYRRELTRQKSKSEKDKKDKDSKEDVKEAKVKAELMETLQTYDSAVKKMRTDQKRLAEELRKSNLSNAKLVYATKLMQNENLSENKRRVVLEQLELAKSVREVKKLYTALSEALSGKKAEGQDRLTESSKATRNIIGGSSKATKAGSSMLSESEQKEFGRWGQLAGFLNE